jgi:phosphatidylglycerophosphate synthase
MSSAPPPSYLESWSRGHAVATLAAIGVSALAQSSRLVAIVAALSFARLIALGRGRFTDSTPSSERGGKDERAARDAPKLGNGESEKAKASRAGRFGPANGVTLLRLALVVIAGVAAPKVPLPLVGASFVLAFLLDALDGFVARKTESASTFGGHFDMETDALLVAVAGVALSVRQGAMAWALVPASLRYLYVVCIWVLPPKGGEAPRSNFARYAFLVSTLGLLVPFFSSTWASAALSIGVGVPLVSFARTFRYCYGKPRAPGAVSASKS